MWMSYAFCVHQLVGALWTMSDVVGVDVEDLNICPIHTTGMRSDMEVCI